jgi:hypothetical protein
MRLAQDLVSCELFSVNFPANRDKYGDFLRNWGKSF